MLNTCGTYYHISCLICHGRSLSCPRTPSETAVPCGGQKSVLIRQVEKPVFNSQPGHVLENQSHLYGSLALRRNEGLAQKFTNYWSLWKEARPGGGEDAEADLPVRCVLEFDISLPSAQGSELLGTAVFNANPTEEAMQTAVLAWLVWSADRRRLKNSHFLRVSESSSCQSVGGNQRCSFYLRFWSVYVWNFARFELWQALGNVFKSPSVLVIGLWKKNLSPPPLGNCCNFHKLYTALRFSETFFFVTSHILSIFEQSLRCSKQYW